MTKQLRFKSVKPQKQLRHKYKCILVLNNVRARSKYFDIINLPVTQIPTLSRNLNNHVGMWTIKYPTYHLIC